MSHSSYFSICTAEAMVASAVHNMVASAVHILKCEETQRDSE